MKNLPLHRRLRFAWQGVRAAWRAEMSFRQQCGATVCVVLSLVCLRPALLWWALLLLNCGMVLAAELFNSALEHALDHLHPEQHPMVGIAKDCAAAAVLALSITAVCLFCLFLLDTLRR